jgi:hypothetical protein
MRPTKAAKNSENELDVVVEAVVEVAMWLGVCDASGRTVASVWSSQEVKDDSPLSPSLSTPAK